MHCEAFAQGRCRSCTLLPVPHGRQVADKERAVRALVADAVAATASSHRHDAVGPVWDEPSVGVSSHFRNKAKMVVGATVDAPTLGITDAGGQGVDLQGCPLYEDAITQALPVIAAFITRAHLVPYDVPSRTGELKYVIVTSAPTGELMVRFVMRSTEAHARIKKHLGWLREQLPHLVVATLNVLPEHKAVLEGERELILTEQATLPLHLGEVTLHVGARSFFQTNTAMARELYACVRAWVSDVQPRTVWDLYCGVGGFALHCAAPGRAVVGVEQSAEAVDAARSAAAEAAAAGVPGMDSVTFVAHDATTWVSTQQGPDLVIVNPPRRGIGEELASWLEASAVRYVVYSSCNATTLARDLKAMPSLRPTRARLVDMFPHTSHYEVVTLLERAPR